MRGIIVNSRFAAIQSVIAGKVLEMFLRLALNKEAVTPTVTYSNNVIVRAVASTVNVRCG